MYQRKPKPAAPKPAASETAETQSAADALEAWLMKQPGQRAVLTKLAAFYKQHPAAGATVKSKGGARKFAAGHGQRFRVSGEAHAMAIRATRDAERRYDTDGVLYTKAEFVGEYGGTLEWELAERELHVDGAAPVASSSSPSALAATLQGPADAIELLKATKQNLPEIAEFCATEPQPHEAIVKLVRSAGTSGIETLVLKARLETGLQLDKTVKTRSLACYLEQCRLIF